MWKPKTLSEGLTETELAYLACAFDTEGSLIVTRRLRPSKSYAYKIRAEIYNKNPQLLEILSKILERKVIEHKTCPRIMLPPNLLRELLPLILPYLTKQKKKAEILLNILKILNITKDIKTKRPSSFEAKLSKLYQEFRN